MKHLTVLFLAVVMSVFFIACEKAEDNQAGGDDTPAEGTTEGDTSSGGTGTTEVKDQIVISSGALQALLPSEGSCEASESTCDCVTVQAGQFAALAVKKGDAVLCNNAEEGKKCIERTGAKFNLIWDGKNNKLVPKGGLSSKNCKSLEAVPAAAGQQAPVATGEQAADDGKQGGPAPAGQGGGTAAGSQAAPAAGQQQTPAAEQQQEQQQGAGQEQQQGAGGEPDQQPAAESGGSGNAAPSS